MGHEDARRIHIEDSEDAVLIDPGMGPMTYLTLDGRVLIDFTTWDCEETRQGLGLVMPDDNESFAALVVGAKKTGIAELLDLLPPCPGGASRCPKCRGVSWARVRPEYDMVMICTICSGRGWADDAMTEAARQRGDVW